jgi:hypothetical protein
LCYKIDRNVRATALVLDGRAAGRHKTT